MSSIYDNLVNKGNLNTPTTIDTQIEKIETHKMKEILRQNKIIPSQEEAYQTFWGLKKGWWKQIIDGVHHQFGPEVYDKGLHGGHIEPGYLKSIKKACKDISQHFEDSITFDQYKNIHHISCSHFKGKKNDTLMEADQIDRFRNDITTMRCAIPNFKEWKEAHDIMIMNENAKFITDPNIKSLLKNALPEAMNKMKKLESEQLEMQNKIEDLLKKMGEKYNLQPKNHSTCGKGADCFSITYKCKDEELLANTTSKIFDTYNKSMQQLRIQTLKSLKVPGVSHDQVKKEYQQKAKENIATLFAELEWLHPWIDGQGRSDLVLLNYLLTQEGLNPAILEEPYFSSSASIEEWIIYLEKGLERWKRDFLKSNETEKPNF